VNPPSPNESCSCGCGNKLTNQLNIIAARPSALHSHRQDYPACRTSLGLLVSNETFYPTAVRAAEQLVRDRGMARLVVINRAVDTGIDPNKRHSREHFWHACLSHASYQGEGAHTPDRTSTLEDVGTAKRGLTALVASRLLISTVVHLSLKGVSTAKSISSIKHTRKQAAPHLPEPYAHPAPPAAQAQRRRRTALARLRNLAVSVSLNLEEAVLWVDADITFMPPHTLSTLADSGKDIVTTITKGFVPGPPANSCGGILAALCRVLHPRARSRARQPLQHSHAMVPR
jgi:hypothetical protein